MSVDIESKEKIKMRHRLIGITVSVNFDDYLQEIIHQNSKFFTKWVIITEKQDFKTINLIKKSKIKNIEILYYNFRPQFNVMFDKGGAIRMAQEYVHQNYKSENILILDSDIYLPDNFADLLNSITIRENILYGASKIDYIDISNFKNKLKGKEYKTPQSISGYFQLYKKNLDYLYEPSINCSQCDLEFRDLFPNLRLIENLVVSHIGETETHWNGRFNKSMIPPKVLESIKKELRKEIENEFKGEI